MELNREEMEEVFGWLCWEIDCNPQQGDCKDWRGNNLYEPENTVCRLCQRFRQELAKNEEQD